MQTEHFVHIFFDWLKGHKKYSDREFNGDYVENSYRVHVLG